MIEEHDVDIAAFLAQKCKTLEHLKQIHANLLIRPHRIQFGAVIAPLISFTVASCNPVFFSHARAIFQNLRCRTTFLYNTMIRGFVQFNQPAYAISCYKDMVKDRIIRNNYTFTPLVKACSMTLHEFSYLGILAHSHVLKLGFGCDRFIVSALIEFYALKCNMVDAQVLFDEMPVKDVVLWTAMIDGFGKFGDVEKARFLFDEMPERNMVSWSAMMGAYSRVSNFKEVLSLYKRMEGMGLKPNESILVTALTACAHLGALAQGVWIHSYAKRWKYDLNPILATALIEMYSKCGLLGLALAVFNDIDEKDSRSWNAILSGTAMSGDAMKSLELFVDMVSSGAKPTEATFVAVLTACTHAKWVDMGLCLFDSMRIIYKVEPRIEHYACVVDLLARSGRLEEAEEFMEEKMDGSDRMSEANLWGAILGACRIYGNVEVGNRVWKKISDEGIDDYGIHILAYNMYKETGWEAEAKSVRRLIGERPARKKPGSSAIEVDGMVQEFHAGSLLLHPMADEILKVLNCST